MNKNEAKVAVAGMELWMSVTHAGDVRRIRCYFFFCLKRNLLRRIPLCKRGVSKRCAHRDACCAKCFNGPRAKPLRNKEERA